jgi:hypothetical protein
MTLTLEIPALPDDGWQLNSEGPKLHPIGDDSACFVAFGTWPKEEFCKSLAELMHHLGWFLGEPTEEELPHPEEVDHCNAAFLPDIEGSDWGLNWGNDDNGARIIPVTMWIEP